MVMLKGGRGRTKNLLRKIYHTSVLPLKSLIDVSSMCEEALTTEDLVSSACFLHSSEGARIPNPLVSGDSFGYVTLPIIVVLKSFCVSVDSQDL